MGIGEVALAVAVHANKTIGNTTGIERQKSYTPVEITTSTAYINNKTGALVSNNDYLAAEVAVNAGEVYRVVGTYNAKTALYGLYDSNGDFVELFPYNVTSITYTEGVTVTIPEGVTTLKISGQGINHHRLLLYKVTDDGYEVPPKNDVLYGKKWYVLGDSFSAGYATGYTDKDGHTYEESDAFDPIKGQWRTYSYWVSQRTGIISNNQLCASGMDFTNVEGAENPFSATTSPRNYTMIPSDCDYITLMFGLNELELTAEQIGTSADTTNATLWGAYYVVLNSILTANPAVKIGIIISDAWMCNNTTYYAALKEIAEYWGIPYLDLTGGNPEVPMMNGRKGTHSALAESLRRSVFAISASNPHPTPLGHKYRSTVIEAFLKTL